MLQDIDIENCLATLHKGGVILYPTDTVWGLGCDATNEAAVEKIYRIKQRNEDKSMIILLADEKEIIHYTDQRDPVIFDYIKGIIKPTTIIYEAAKGLAKNIINKDGSIGIRVVQENFCRKLITLFGKPIVSTSSNISGYPPPMFYRDIDITIKQAVNYIVQYRQDDINVATPSTVVKLGRDGKIIIIRP